MSEIERIIEKKRAREEKERKLKKRHAEAVAAACQCFSTESGKEFLKWFMSECGYQSPSSVVHGETGEISFNATIHNEARRGVYLRVRNLLASRPDILAEVENNIKGESK